MEILTLNKIAACGTEKFGAQYTVGDAVTAPQGIMVRSASMHDMAFPASLLAVARAGAGGFGGSASHRKILKEKRDCLQPVPEIEREHGPQVLRRGKAGAIPAAGITPR